VRKLQDEDSKLCHSLYEYQSQTSESSIKSLILINGGYGLFSKTNDELLSFALINDHFATGMLYTVEHARGKKYGEFIAKLLSLKIAEEIRVSPTCFIDPTNIPSLNLYNKLGYKKIGDCNWIAVRSKNNIN
jgi:predicted GNAT family acetyltransferase